MKRQSFPTIVTPPPPDVPVFIVTLSRIWLRFPITSLVNSPVNFKSWGISPTVAYGKTVVPSPTIVSPTTVTLFFNMTPDFKTTLGPT